MFCAEEENIKTDPRKYVKVRDLFWTGFITGLRRKELCTRRTKIMRQAPKTSVGQKNEEASQKTTALLLFFNQRGTDSTETETRRKRYSLQEEGAGVLLEDGKRTEEEGSAMNRHVSAKEFVKKMGSGVGGRSVWKTTLVS